MSVRTKNVEPETDDTVLPPGQRDRSGFWIPLGCDDPRTLVRRRGRRSGERRPLPVPDQEESRSA